MKIRLFAAVAAIALALSLAGCPDPHATDNPNIVVDPDITLPDIPLQDTPAPSVDITAGHGCVVDTGDDVYYWDYNENSYADGALLFYINLSENATATMTRRDADGVVTPLFEAALSDNAFAVTADGIFYVEDGTITRCDLDGGNKKALCAGVIKEIDSTGTYLIAADETSVFSLTADGTKTIITDNGTYLTVYDDTVYFSPALGRTDASKGVVTLSAANVDGTDVRELHTTDGGLYKYDTSVSNAAISQMCFDEDYIYFSYGSIGGTGHYFQGGLVDRVRYDGTDGSTVAGDNDNRMGPYFTVIDGEVSAEWNDFSEAMFSYMTEFNTVDRVTYQKDPATGEVTAIVSADEYIEDTSLSHTVNYMEVTDDKAYFLVHSATTDPSQAMGWRDYYVREQSTLYCKDLQSGDITAWDTF